MYISLPLVRQHLSISLAYVCGRGGRAGSNLEPRWQRKSKFFGLSPPIHTKCKHRHRKYADKDIQQTK